VLGAEKLSGLSSAEKAQVLTDQIDEALEDLSFQLSQGHTDKYLQMLEFYSRFWKYSIGNSILIYLQRPDATLVAGFKKWAELGFTVKPGEKGLAIRAPWLKKEIDQETGEIKERLIGYLATFVFDISQTKEYPAKQPPTIFAPVHGDWQSLYEHVRLWAFTQGVAMTESAMPEGVHGMYSNSNVFINERLQPFYKLTTALHEYVHHVAHGSPDQRDNLTRDQREWEAESVTYVLCRSLGIEHETARDYLLSYHFTTEDLEAVTRKVSALVKQITADLHLAEEAKKKVPEAVAA
jgi:hypothetical protein